MSVLPRPMAGGMIKHVVIVFGGIFGILVEPSLTNMARPLFTTPTHGFEYWTWPADRSGSLVQIQASLCCGSSMYPSPNAADSVWFASSSGMISIKSTREGKGSLDGVDRVVISVYFVTILQNVEITSFFLPCYDECMAGRVFSIVQRQLGNWPLEFQWAEASFEKKFFKPVSFLGRHSSRIFIIYGPKEVEESTKILTV
ncbi:hypothetical protein Peur_026883 [Populus x canadensis]